MRVAGLAGIDKGDARMKRVWLPIIIIYCAVANGFAAPELKTSSLFEETKITAPESAIDAIVFRGFAKKGIRPSYCSDAVFLRRAYLDIIGTLPTADEARAFLNDPSLSKRRALVDRLLGRDAPARCGKLRPKKTGIDPSWVVASSMRRRIVPAPLQPPCP